MEQHISNINKYIDVLINDVNPLISETDTEKMGILIDDKLKIASNKIYKELNLSLLDGEYVNLKISEFPDLDKKFNQLLEILSDIKDDISIFTNANEDFCKILLFDIKRYKSFIHYISQKIEKPERILISIENNDENTSINLDNDTFNFKKIRELFDINFSLSISDIFLSVEIEDIFNLVKINTKLNRNKDDYDNEEPFIYKSLKCKCDLLTLKFWVRYKNDEIFNSLFISSDGLDYKIDPSKNSKNSKHTNFEELIINAYSINERDNINYLSEKKDIKDCQKDSDYFLNIQYALKQGKLNLISNIIRKYRIEKYDRIKEGQSVFDDYSIRLNLNYLYNNKLSLICRKFSQKIKASGIKEVDKALEEIKLVQDETNIRNYYPHMKSAQCYVKYIDYLFQSVTTPITENFDEAEKYLNKLKECNENIKADLDFDERTCFHPFRPTYKECIDDNIFIYSSFIIPIEYSKQDKKLKILESDYNRLNTILSLNKSLMRDRNEIKKAREEVNNSQKHNIEILSIFSSLVLFVLGSIQIFQKFENIQGATQFMIVLAFCLCVFSLVMGIIFCQNKYAKYITGSIIIILMTYFVYKYLPDNKKYSSKIQNKENLEINKGNKDSIYTNTHYKKE